MGLSAVLIINKVHLKCLSRVAFALGLFFSAHTSIAEQTSPKQWLGKMSLAMQQLNYQGVFIYRRADDIATMKVTHIVDEQGARELLETLTGEARRELRGTPATGLEGAAQLERIDIYYELKLLGSDRAAGRDTQLVSVSPRDEYRYGYRLWLDRDTGLLLKSDLLDQKGATLEQVMFTSLELLPSGQIAENFGVDPVTESSAVTQVEQSTKPRWVVGKLPDGFLLLNADANSLNSNFEHRVYSDGLASVSVFVERAKSKGEAFIGVSSMGAVSAFGNIEDGYQITVVGDVPEVTVTTIGQSISLEAASQ